MDPALYRTFAEAFVTEWNRAQGDAAADRSAHETELQRARQQIERLVDALANGMPPASVGARLQQLKDRRLQLEAILTQAAPEVPRLHPALPELHRAKMADLVSALDSEDGAAARDLVCDLIEHITLHPEADGHRIEVRGELAAILGPRSFRTCKRHRPRHFYRGLIACIASQDGCGDRMPLIPNSVRLVMPTES